MSIFELLLPLYLPWFFICCAHVSIYVLWTEALEKNGAQADLIGAVFATVTIGGTVMMPIVGRLSEVYGNHIGFSISLITIGLVPILLAILHTKSTFLYFPLAFSLGSGFSFFNMNLMDIVAVKFKAERRGLVLSIAGGLFRLGGAVGPLCLSLIASESLKYAFLAQTCLYALAFACQQLFWFPKREADSDENEENTLPSTKKEEATKRDSFLVNCKKIFSKHYHSIMNVGFFSFLLSVLRAARDVLLPLAATDKLGLSVERMGVVTSISYFSGVLTFPLAGILMDRFGRRWSALLSVTFLGIGLGSIFFTNDFISLLVVASIAGLGNGLSSGLVMTMGTDIAPSSTESRSQFIGLYRLIADTGNIFGPLISGVLVKASGAGVAGLTMFFLSVITCFYIKLVLPETRDYSK
eukprot:g387.t1